MKRYRLNRPLQLLVSRHLRDLQYLQRLRVCAAARLRYQQIAHGSSRPLELLFRRHARFTYR